MFVRDLTRIRKFKTSPSEFCPISGDWGELGPPNMAYVSHKKLLNAAKCQVCSSFYHFSVIKEKPTGGDKRFSQMPVFLSYRGQSVIWNVNKLTGVYIMKTLVLLGLMLTFVVPLSITTMTVVRNLYLIPF